MGFLLLVSKGKCATGPRNSVSIGIANFEIGGVTSDAMVHIEYEATPRTAGDV